MNLPLPYISHSQFWLFNHDPEKYYQQYYVSRLDQATKPMIFGKIFQEAWCDRGYNYPKKLRKAGFTPDYVRIIKTAFDHPKMIRFPKIQTEKQYRAIGMGLKHPILGIFDGFKLKDRWLLENKTGKALWTQERTDDATQITWYALICYLEFGFMPKRLTLQSISSRNGQVVVHETKRDKEDFKFLIDAINEMHDRIVDGDFNKI